MAVIAVVPQIISSMMAVDLNTASFFGGTGLLIIVGVALDLVQRGVPARADEVVLTSGSQQGIDLIARSLVNPGDAVLVESYIPGRELTVAVMGDRALGVTELRTHEGFYDYAAKYEEGRATHLCPAPIPDEIADLAMEYALKAHETLGCRGVSRADLRYDDTGGQPGDLYMLEINTQPGMTPLSLVPEVAAHAGIDFPQLVSWIVEDASCPR
mgnify:CR=1 FL=1